MSETVQQLVNYQKDSLTNSELVAALGVLGTNARHDLGAVQAGIVADDGGQLNECLRKGLHGKGLLSRDLKFPSELLDCPAN